MSSKAERLKEIRKRLNASRNDIKDTIIAYWAMFWYFAEKWGLVVYEG